MKISMFSKILGLAALMSLLAACGTTGTTTSQNARKQSLLAASGFKQYTVTTPTQQQLVAQLPTDKVSAVKYKGKLVYVFPTEKKDVVYAGRQAQFNRYKKALAAQRAQSAPAPATGPSNSGNAGLTASQQQGERQMAGYADFTEETAGPNHVMINQFDGFGPMPGTDESY